MENKTLRRSCFTLLETLIALVLTALVVTFLTYFYNQITVINQKTEVLQQQSFKMRYIENRLSQVIPRTVSAETASDDFYFFTMTNPPGLIFTYDNQADKNKAFGNHVLGRLFLGEDQKLYLATWPSPNRWIPLTPPPVKLEVLLTGVQELTFEFFVPPDKHWKPNFINSPARVIKTKVTPKAIEKPAEEGGWAREWKQEYKLLPALLRLNIKVDKATWQFVFPLPETQRQVVYS